MIKIIIEETVLQTDGKTRFAFSKAVSKLGEVENRHGDVSVSFTVPNTAHNNKALGGVMQLRQPKQPATVKYKARLEEHNQTLSTGHVQVLKGGRRIDIRFFGGNADWFSSIRDTTLQDLDLTALEHTYEAATIISSFDNTEGIKYSLFDDGRNGRVFTGTGNIVTEPEDYLMGVFQSDIVKAIFKKANLKVTGSLLNDPLFLSTLIATDKNFNRFLPDAYERDFGITEPLQSEPMQSVEMNFFEFDQGDSDPFFDGSRYTFGVGVENFAGQFQYVIQNGGNEGSWNANYRIGFQDVGGITTEDFAVPLVTESYITDTDARVTVPQEVNGLSNDLTYLEGEFIEFLGLTFAGDVGEGVRKLYKFKGFERTNFQFQLSGDAFHQTVDVASVMPELQLDIFMKELMFRHGVISQYNGKTNTVNFSKLDVIQDNIHKAPDWSNKYDASKDANVDYFKLVSNYSRISNLRYSTDPVDTSLIAYNLLQPSLNFGDGKVTIDNDFITDESDIFQSAFAGSVLRWTFPYDLGVPEDARMLLPYIPLFIYNEEVPPQGSEAVHKELLPKPRILLDAGNINITEISRTESSIWLKDFNEIGSGTNISSVGYFYFAKTFIDETETVAPSDILNKNIDTLAFNNPIGANFYGVDLITRNYSLLGKILNNSYYLPLYMNIKPSEIANFDFEIPIYLESGVDTGYFYVDEFYQYQGNGKSTLVNFVKI